MGRSYAEFVRFVCTRLSQQQRSLVRPPAPYVERSVQGEMETIPMDMVEAWTTPMPHATLLKVPNAAHFTYAERPELVWPAVEKFLSGNDRPVR